ncbi:excinuclease ABC subunit UvrB [Candidatus Saccharibacteria bacterium]|nr:excinuclease ABC subunit UvrB [Candidatus Saccharibacteria bacterium]
MMPKFKLQSKYRPSGDQPAAIKKLVDGIKSGEREQTLLGVTGSGKTFTMANIIEQTQRPTLVLAHNKTLAAQLYSEFREFFPNNEVHFFVSYFDYYQPEAYIASTDTYIEKDSAINEEIDRLRHGATEALLTRKDVIVVASVSCIYGIGSPAHYTAMSLPLWKKNGKWDKITQQDLIKALVTMQYHRNDLAFERGNFRVHGDTIDLFPANGEHAYRFEFDFDELREVKIVHPLTFELREKPDHIHIFPNTHYATPQEDMDRALVNIEAEFKDRLQFFNDNRKYLEAQRLSQRTKYDLEMLENTGMVKGIENYSRHLEGRAAGEPPYTLLDFFPKDFLLIVDESHMTIPQVRGMFNGDHARKTTLVEHGFRLPSALDNRPLTFTEFDERLNQIIYVSATPGKYELERSPKPVEQVIRPTGLLDPKVEVRSSNGQIDNLLEEIDQRIAKKQRVLITTLTKRMAEDLTEHLQERGVKTAYIHSDIDTLERGDILRDLRAGVYDVLVGINLLREGLDLPEVSLVAILDADKEGFLRSESALIQTIGRAARHVEGKVIMYADNITESMENAISETNRRREIQQTYNREHHITPKSIEREVSKGLRAVIPEKEQVTKLDLRRVPPEEFPSLIKELTSQMQLAAANLDFERAALLRDQITELKDRKK